MSNAPRTAASESYGYKDLKADTASTYYFGTSPAAAAYSSKYGTYPTTAAASYATSDSSLAGGGCWCCYILLSKFRPCSCIIVIFTLFIILHLYPKIILYKEKYWSRSGALGWESSFGAVLHHQRGICAHSYCVDCMRKHIHVNYTDFSPGFIFVLRYQQQVLNLVRLGKAQILLPYRLTWVKEPLNTAHKTSLPKKCAFGMVSTLWYLMFSPLLYWGRRTNLKLKNNIVDTVSTNICPLCSTSCVFCSDVEPRGTYVLV